MRRLEFIKTGSRLPLKEIVQLTQPCFWCNWVNEVLPLIVKKERKYSDITNARVLDRLVRYISEYIYLMNDS